MDTCMHKTMASVASLEKIEIIRSQEFMQSEVRLKFLKKMIILGPKTAILGPQFCRIFCAGASFSVVRGVPLDLPLHSPCYSHSCTGLYPLSWFGKISDGFNLNELSRNS